MTFFFFLRCLTWRCLKCKKASKALNRVRVMSELKVCTGHCFLRCIHLAICEVSIHALCIRLSDIAYKNWHCITQQRKGVICEQQLFVIISKDSFLFLVRTGWCNHVIFSIFSLIVLYSFSSLGFMTLTIRH